jgi:hypothetical protein
LTEEIHHDPINVIPVTTVNRHCTLAEALTFIKKYNGMVLGDFEKVITVIRNPYSLEYSYYQHLRKPHVKKRRRAEGKPHLIDLAEGSFRTFAKLSGYHREDTPQDGFFKIEGEIPEQVDLIRFEELSTAFPQTLKKYRKEGVEHPFPHRNKSSTRATAADFRADGVEEAVYKKYQFMFDSGLYQRSPELFDLP